MQKVNCDICANREWACVECIYCAELDLEDYYEPIEESEE